MKREIVYDGEARPHVESNFEIILKFVLKPVLSVVKMVSAVCEGISVRCLKHRHMPD